MHWIDFKSDYKPKRLRLHFTLTNRDNRHRKHKPAVKNLYRPCWEPGHSNARAYLTMLTFASDEWTRLRLRLLRFGKLSHVVSVYNNEEPRPHENCAMRVQMTFSTISKNKNSKNHKIVLFPQEFNTCWLYKLRDPSSQTALISSLSLLSSCYIMSCNWCCKNCPAGHVIRMCVHSLLGSYETCASPTACTSLAWYVGKTVKGSWAHNTSGVESGIMLPKNDVKKVLL